MYGSSAISVGARMFASTTSASPCTLMSPLPTSKCTVAAACAQPAKLTVYLRPATSIGNETVGGAPGAPGARVSVSGHCEPSPEFSRVLDSVPLESLHRRVSLAVADGRDRGSSISAAREGIAKCCVPRIVWNVPNLLIPPFVMASLEPYLRRSPHMRLPGQKEAPSSRDAGGSASSSLPWAFRSGARH